MMFQKVMNGVWLWLRILLRVSSLIWTPKNIIALHRLPRAWSFTANAFDRFRDF